MPRRPSTAATHEVIDRLFTDPPVNDADLRRRLARIPAAEARRVLVDRLCAGIDDERDGEILVAALDRLGTGRERERLIDLAADRTRSRRARACCLAVLASGDAHALEDLLASLAPDDAAELGELPLVDLLTSIQADPTRVDDLLRAVVLVPDEARDLLLERIEHHRRQLGTPAAAVYGRLAATPALVRHRGDMLAVLATEPSPDTIGLLERLRDQAAEPRLRRDLQGALLRARTRSIEPEHAPPAPSGHALVGSCDGQGTFVVLGGFENPDATLTIAELRMRVAGDVRDGCVSPRRTLDDLQQLARSIAQEEGARFARVPLPAAATLVAEAVERTTAAGLGLPEGTAPAVALFARATAPHDASPEPEPDPAAVVAPARLERLLRARGYERWFFDHGDLRGHGVAAPRGRPGPRWTASALARMDRLPLRLRVAAMARHAARLHAWQDEAEEAALMAVAARDVEADFQHSALARVLIARSIRSARPARAPSPTGYGDVEVRRALKDRFFHDVRAPRGRDLARLDLTEATLSCLVTAFAALPAERRPREEEHRAAAFALGRTFADTVSGRGADNAPRLARRMADALGRCCRLTVQERWLVLHHVLPALAAFLDQVCERCPVRCLDHPGARMADPFFGSDHPASGAPPRPKRA